MIKHAAAILILILAAFFVPALQSPAFAQGVQSGQLTAGETSKLERKESAINQEVRTDRSLNGGKLTTHRKLAEAAMARLAPFFPALRGDWTADAALPGFPQNGMELAF